MVSAKIFNYNTRCTYLDENLSKTQYSNVSFKSILVDFTFFFFTLVHSRPRPPPKKSSTLYIIMSRFLQKILNRNIHSAGNYVFYQFMLNNKHKVHLCTDVTLNSEIFNYEHLILTLNLAF